MNFRSVLKGGSLWAVAAAAALAAGEARAQDSAYQAGEVDTGEALASLVAGKASIRPGERFDVALRLDTDPHWHVYWKNPGDVGMPPEVDWRAPEGFEFGPMAFPPPRRIPFGQFVSYGYEGEVYFLFRATAPETLRPGETVRIEADASWLICKDVCIPGEAKLALELPVAPAGADAAPSERAEDLAAARASLPLEAEGVAMAYELIGEGESLSLIVDWPGFEGVALEEPYFYLDQEGVSDSAGEQRIALNGNRLRAVLPISSYFSGELPDRISGLLESAAPIAEGKRFVAFDSEKAASDVDVAAVPEGGEAGLSPEGGGLGLAKALAFAFVGGAILNLMPCVFPIIGIKILGFARKGGQDRRKILVHGLAFGAGVLASFWALAGVLLALRAGGASLGWGFQLQEPAFLAALLAVFFLLGLSLAGVFEIGGSAISLAGKVEDRGLRGSFLSGVLATAVATPCTAPFMGAALGFALAIGWAKALLVFTFLGLGMAAPYVTLSACPRLLAFLPNPGSWMETFKQLMAFPLFATCVWLVWLLGLHVGVDGLLWTLGGLLGLALAGWIYGRWAVPSRRTAVRGLARAASLALLVAGVWAMLPSKGAAASLPGEARTGSDPDGWGIQWLPYSERRVDRLRAAGRPVFIDFTASWCITCKANEAVVFSSSRVRERFEELNVAMLKADWTKRDPEITRALEAFGRSGVPFYVLYPGEGEAITLPELLNPPIVLDALDELEAAMDSKGVAAAGEGSSASRG